MYNRLIFDGEMFDFLDRNNSRIAQILIHGMSGLIKEEGNFIKREESEIDTLSYLPKSKYEIARQDEGKDPFGEGVGRTKIKVGRFVKRFLNKTAFEEFRLNDSDVEKFVNLYKSYFNTNESNLKVVSGEDIMKYYSEETYFRPGGYQYGTLWNSCMRQKERNKFMELYAVNSDIKMLVLLTEDGLVRARALLWENVKEYNSDKVYKMIDRVYGVYDHDVDFFKKWASKNGYISKWIQNAKSERDVDIDGIRERRDLYVELSNHQLDYYPYLDTFKYYNTWSGKFSNTPNYSFDYILVQSSGRTHREEEQEEEYDDDSLDF